jgi:L-rhamnose mutarotase
MHENPWPEIMAAHSEAGISNYSIFRDGNRFFYVYECADAGAANEYLAKNADCQRWNAITSGMVEGGFDLERSDPISYMKEVFRLP